MYNMNDTHWYDKDEVSQWYTMTVNQSAFDNLNEYFYRYSEIVSWIGDRVDNPYRHARWTIGVEEFVVKFRYERDYLMCMLSWS